MSKKTQERKSQYSARKTAEKQQAGFGSNYLKLPAGVKLFRLAEGPNYIDIIPFTAGEGNPNADKGHAHYEREFYTHRNMGSNNEMAICPARTADSKCPVCEKRAQLRKDADADENLVKSMAPQRRQIFNVINTKDRASGIQIWDVSFFLFGEKLNEKITNDDENDGWDSFFDPSEGKTLKIIGKKMSFPGGSPFIGVGSIELRDRSTQYGEKILKKAICLDDILEIPEYKELKAKLLQEQDGEEEDDEDEEDEDETPKGKKAKPGKKSKPSKEEEDDEDDDEEDDDEEDDDEESEEEEDDEEEEEAPKSKKKPAKKKPKKDDDEDEDSDDSDDEEEEEDEDADADDEDEEDDDGDEEADEADEDDEKPKAKKKAPAKKKPKKDDDEEDEDEDVDGDEDEDEEEWDDEDEEEDDEEEEEEEKPAKKKKKK